MKHVLVVLLVLLVAAPAAAEKPVQLSLLNPIQIVSEDESVSGISLGLLYTKQANTSGLQWSWLASHNTGDLLGVQWGPVNVTEGAATAWQWGLVNYTRGDFTGYQLGLVNVTKSKNKAFQWGAVNIAEHGGGLMLGLVNYAKTMDGLQIGLLNIISQKDNLPVLPIVNWTF